MTINDVLTIGLVFVVGAIVWGIVRELFDPHSYHELYRLLRQTTNDAARTSVELIETRGLLREYEEGYKLNYRRMQMRGVEPAWEPTRTSEAISNGGSVLLPLYDLLYDRFNDSELFDLAFRIGLTRDGMTGDTHAERTQCLVEYADRRNIVNELIEVGRVERPELEWPTIREEM